MSADQPQKTYWFTGVLMKPPCECQIDSELEDEEWLIVCTDGKSEWASCDICNKTWDTKTMKEIKR